MSRKTPVAKQNGIDQAEARDAERIAAANVILARAQQGDTSVLPELQRLLDEDASIWIRCGNLASIARIRWIQLISGKNLLWSESLDRACLMQIAELVGADAPLMERFLAERVVICRLQVSHADVMLAQAGPGASRKVVEALEKRITVCQKRLSAAIKDLATVRKLLGSAAVPISQVAQQPQSAAATASPVNHSASAVTADTSSEDPILRMFGEQPAFDTVAPNNGESGRRNGYNNRITQHLETIEV